MIMKKEKKRGTEGKISALTGRKFFVCGKLTIRIAERDK